MDPNILASFSILGGVLPALLWVWFWLKEDRLHPEPRNRLAVTFITGMVAVLLVLPVEKLVFDHMGSIRTLTIVYWAIIEEVFKFGCIYFVALRKKENDEPIDAVIYMITGALGFSALENTFFLWQLVDNGLFTQSIITSNMRFLGATLLHTATSAVIGILYAFSFYQSKLRKEVAIFTGIALSVILHTIFNLLIIKSGEKIFFVFAGLWLFITLLIVVLEKVKTIRAPKF